MKATAITIILLLLFIPAFSQSGSITNIQVSQRTDGSGLVDIFFDLTGKVNYNILLEVSFNGGLTYAPVSANYTEGDMKP